MKPYKYNDRLETDRLRTRFLTQEDVHVWTNFYLQEENNKYVLDLGGQSPEENAKLAVQRQLERYAENKYGLQALIEKSTGSIIGQCGLLNQRIGGKVELEIGYQLFNHFWGKYFATEAGILFRNYAFYELGAESIIAIIDLDNANSQRVAERLQMQKERRVWHKDSQVYMYRINREVWLSL